jgi:outer membrane protein assembly factor BamB
MAKRSPQPTLIPLEPETEDGAAKLRLVRTKNPRPRQTLGDLGVAIRVTGPRSFATTLLTQPFDAQALIGIEPTSVRVFRFNGRALRPHWDSGINVGLGFVWAKITSPGTYVPIGLPRDRLLQVALLEMARARFYGTSSVEESRARLRDALQLFHELPVEELEELRALLTRVEVQTGASVAPQDVRPGRGGHLIAFPFPGDSSLDELRRRLASLEPTVDGLAEEALLFPPERLFDDDLPWPTRPGLPPVEDWLDKKVLDRFSPWLRDWLHKHFPWFWSRNWWMYQHDVRHSGHASGWSGITSKSVGALIQLPTVSLDGPVITKPSIVDGKIYVGSGRYSGGPGGTLHKIDLATGTKEGEFPTTGFAFYSWYQGVGGSPAARGGRVYFTAVHGKVYCLDATTMTPGGTPHPPPLWVTDLKNVDPAHNQPVNQPDADSWTGPLVVNGRVYVGCGEGESAPTYGFVFCLDAATGNVIWCFCTAKFQNRHAPGTENAPNVIPASVAISDPLPAWATAAGFVIHPDPSADRSTGCSVWSSPAYDRVLDRIYVGTGNSQYGPGWTGTTAPDKWYGSGCISLDATTGQFRGFHQSQADDSYWPNDSDIDVPGSPSVFSLGATRAVAYGCKNGSFFVLDADTMAPIARRQLLPRTGGNGLPGDRGAGIDGVVSEPPAGGEAENDRGIFGTPALDGFGRIFVGLGGYNGMALDAGAGIDPTRVPFMRALNSADLHDAWPTAVGPDNVSRYTTTKPPMYMSLEVALSSPAVVNDVVFVSTDKAGLYALDVATGLCLWSATGLPPGPQAFVLGPAVYGNYVVIGAGNSVRIYTLPWIVRKPWPPLELILPWWRRLRWPPPPPERFGPLDEEALVADRLAQAEE